MFPEMGGGEGYSGNVPKNAFFSSGNRPLVTGETLTIGSQLRKTWFEKASQILRTNIKVEFIFCQVSSG